MNQERDTTDHSGTDGDIQDHRTASENTEVFHRVEPVPHDHDENSAPTEKYVAPQAYSDTNEPMVNEEITEINPSTTVLPVVPMYEEYDPVDPESDVDVAYAYQQYGMFAPENIPPSDKTDDWVYLPWYEQLFVNIIRSGEFYARLVRKHDQLLQRNGILEQRMEEMEAEVAREADANRLARSRNESDRKKIDDDRRELETRDRHNTIVKYSLIALSILLAILTTVFLFLWLNSRDDNKNMNQSNDVTQSQAKQTKDALDKARQERDQANADNKTLSEKVDSLNKQISDARGVSDQLKGQNGDQSKKIDDLNNQINELKNNPPSTVTETKESKSDPRTVMSTVTQNSSPETETKTVTVTEQSNGNGNTGNTTGR